MPLRGRADYIGINYINKFPIQAVKYVTHTIIRWYVFSQATLIHRERKPCCKILVLIWTDRKPSNQCLIFTIRWQSDTSLISPTRSICSYLPTYPVLNDSWNDHYTKSMKQGCIAAVAWTSCYCMTSSLCRQKLEEFCLTERSNWHSWLNFLIVTWPLPLTFYVWTFVIIQLDFSIDDY